MSGLFEDATQKYLASVFRNYETKIRGKQKADFEIPFWDVIVITTADTDQMSVYEQQIQLKYDREELPLGVPIHVIADPPGPKIGNGGSTLVAVQMLEKEYKKGLFEKKVLLIHAGGQSQRMPSASVLGKIFSPIPKGPPMYQMLDVKLAMFCPFIGKMHPGIFVTCADDFMLYNLGKDEEDIEFSETGFTAFAHPSSLAIGTGHGVYVPQKTEDASKVSHVRVCNCLQVLQKPNEKKMQESGAIFKSGGLILPKGHEIHGDVVYTDSSFCFSHGVTKNFLQFLNYHGSLDCEIDAYGDFLQALGKKATSDYVYNTSNVSTLCDSLIPTRLSIFKLLQNTKLKLLILNQSKFVHIGTTHEYVSHFCADTHFQFQMGLSKDVFNLWSLDSANLSVEATGEPKSKKQRLSWMKLSDTSLGCVMHSILPLSSTISPTAVVEYCDFGIPVNIGVNCIVSNCKFSPQETSECSSFSSKSDVQITLQTSLNIPNNLFLHTIPVKENESVKYVTVFFDMSDNLKKVAEKSGHLPFLGKQVEDYTAATHVDPSVVAAGCSKQGSKVNLWHCCLFPMTSSMTESLALSLKCVQAVQTDNLSAVSLNEYQLLSMASILQKKHVFEMLKQRSQIYNKIKNS